MDKQTEYGAMCRKLAPFAHPYMTAQQKDSADACIRAGEPYEALLDLLWVAAENHAPRDLLLQALGLVDDEDKEQYRQLIR